MNPCNDGSILDSLLHMCRLLCVCMGGYPGHYCSTCVKKDIIRTLPLCTGIMASISSLSQYTVRSHFLTTRTQISNKTGPIHVYISLLHRTIPKTITGIIVYADGEVIFNTLTRNQWGYSPSLLSLFS